MSAASAGARAAWRFPLRKPPALGPGARLAMVAPASAFEVGAFDAGLAEIATLGFEPVYDESVFARDRYLAGAPALRAAALARAWRDPAIDGIIAVRGGYGSVQLLPLLDYVDMDGAVLIAKDIATGAYLDRGKCIYPNVNGTGVELIDGPF